LDVYFQMWPTIEHTVDAFVNAYFWALVRLHFF